MDPSTSCNSTSTSAPVKLGLRLPVLAFRFDMILISLKLLLRCLWSVYTLQLHALIRSGRGVSVCKFRCMRTRVQFKNQCTAKDTFQGVHEAGRDLLLLGRRYLRRHLRKCSRMRSIVFLTTQCFQLLNCIESHRIALNRTESFFINVHLFLYRANVSRYES